MSLPPLDLASWEPCRLHWQLLCQMLGKVRLKTHPPLNHWWHVPLYVSPKGLTTGDIPYDGDAFDIEHDVLDHQWVIRRGRERTAIELSGRSVAECFSDLERSLVDLEVRFDILAKPFDSRSKVPFARDARRDYVHSSIETAWTVLLQMDGWLKRFRGEFVGKCSPVHMFWHSFDLAVTRFSGRRAPDMESDTVARQAYSHEVISAGFWFGDDNTPEAALYCYAFPSPDRLDRQPLPAGARWIDSRGSPLALLPYESVRRSADPGTLVHEFLESSYDAAATLADWPSDLTAR